MFLELTASIALVSNLFYISCRQGLSQAGSQQGLDDSRTGLVKEGFRVYDSLDGGFTP